MGPKRRDRACCRCAKMSPLEFVVRGDPLKAALCAMQCGHHKCLQWVVDRGVDLKAMRLRDDPDGSSLLFVGVVVQGHDKIVEILLRSGFSPNSCDSKGVPALMVACWSGMERMARILIEDGADVNATTHTGDTALGHVAYSGDVGMAELLIRSGADVGLANHVGDTPLMFATGRGHGAMVELLKKHGAVPTSGTGGGQAVAAAAGPSGAGGKPPCEFTVATMRDARRLLASPEGDGLVRITVCGPGAAGGGIQVVDFVHEGHAVFGGRKMVTCRAELNAAEIEVATYAVACIEAGIEP